jgi:hypothetical protein
LEVNRRRVEGQLATSVAIARPLHNPQKFPSKAQLAAPSA